MSSASWAHKEPFFQPTSYDYEVWESDFSEFVTNHYSRPYCYQQWVQDNGNYNHASNGSSFEVEVEDHDEVWPDAEEQLAQWLAVEYVADEWKYDFEFYRIHGAEPEAIMYDLYRKGIVPAGKYLFKVWW